MLMINNAAAKPSTTNCKNMIIHALSIIPIIFTATLSQKAINRLCIIIPDSRGTFPFPSLNASFNIVMPKVRFFFDMQGIRIKIITTEMRYKTISIVFSFFPAARRTTTLSNSYTIFTNMESMSREISRLNKLAYSVFKDLSSSDPEAACPAALRHKTQ